MQVQPVSQHQKFACRVLSSRFPNCPVKATRTALPSVGIGPICIMAFKLILKDQLLWLWLFILIGYEAL